MAEAVEAPQSKSTGKEDFSTEKSEKNQEIKGVEMNELDKLTELLGAVNLTDNLQKKLNTFHCPFTWQLKEKLFNQSPYDIRLRLKEKEMEIESDEGPYMILRNFGMQLAICFLEWREGDIEAALQRQCNGARLIEDCQDSTIMEGLYHISLSTLAHLKYKAGKLSECEVILKEIVPYENMNNTNKACISGIRAIVLMEFGFEGTKGSIPYIEEALELDQSNPEWHFLLGKSLRRVRKVESFNEIPEHRELKALEKAAEISSCAGYYVFLAQAYRETAFRVFSLNKQNFDHLKEIVNTMNKKSAEYYRKALEMSTDSSHVNIRCAQGFLNLPYPHRNENLAKECLEKALESAPNNAMAHHVFGKYYEQIGDSEKAKSSYETAGQLGAFGAFMDLIRLHFKTDPNYDPTYQLKKVGGIFKEERQKCEVLCQMASYYYLKKNDLKNSAINMLELAENLEQNHPMKSHKPLCMNIKKPFDLMQVIVDESRLALNEENCPSEEGDVYRKLISKFEGTEYLSKAPEAHRTHLLEREAKPQYYGRGRGRGQQRGRGNFHRPQGNSHNTNPHGYVSTSTSNSNREQIQRNTNAYEGNVNPNFESRNFNSNWRNRTQGASNTGGINSGPSVACGNNNIEEKLRIRKEMSMRMQIKRNNPDMKQ